jgi:uncharacterized protein (UPF0332 family)
MKTEEFIIPIAQINRAVKLLTSSAGLLNNLETSKALRRISSSMLSIIQAMFLTQQITLASGNSSRINSNLLHHRRLVSEITSRSVGGW